MNSPGAQLPTIAPSDRAGLVIVTGMPALGSGLVSWIEDSEDLAVEVVGIASTCEQAVNMARGHRAPLMVICADLEPGHILDRVSQAMPELATLVLLEKNRPEAEAKAMRAGAAGVLSSSCSQTAFACSLRSLLRGRATISIAALRVLLGPVQDADLTQRQRQIRDLLNEGLKPKEIAERLMISHNTVKTHISRLRGRLSASESHPTSAGTQGPRAEQGGPAAPLAGLGSNAIFGTPTRIIPVAEESAPTGRWSTARTTAGHPLDP